jgi:hypothetical protein
MSKLVTTKGAELAMVQYASLIVSTADTLAKNWSVNPFPRKGPFDQLDLFGIVQRLISSDVVSFQIFPDVTAMDVYSIFTWFGKVERMKILEPLSLRQNKSRQFGLFIPNAKRTRSNAKNFMRIRVPHA